MAEAGAPYEREMREAERGILIRFLRGAGYVTAQAAAAAGISERRFYYRLALCGVRPSELRRSDARRVTAETGSA